MYPYLNLFGMQIQTYFLWISATATVALLLLIHRNISFDFPLKKILDLYLVSCIFGMLGARAVHVFYEQPRYYTENPWHFFYFWQGGFVYYGGLIFGFLAGFIWSYRQSLDLRKLLDLVTLPLALATGLGRIGCFWAGCCYGKFCELPWAINQKHPTALYSAFWDLGFYFILSALEKNKALKTGQLFFVWILTHALGRLWVEIFRNDFRGPQFIISISSWISLALLLVGFIGFFRIPTRWR